MLKTWLFCSVVCLSGCAGWTQARGASFDCSRAVTAQEKAVCTDAELSKLDEELASDYNAVRSHVSSKAASEIEQDQREWLGWMRQTCPDLKGQGRGLKVCLLNGYTEQLQMLEGGLWQDGGMTVFPRLKVVTAPDTQTPQAGSVDPGFGVGRFRWPEIDSPTPQQTAWNSAVRAKVAWMMSGEKEGRRAASEFNAASVADSEVDIAYTLRAANEHFVAVDLEDSTYDYGAAHPNEYTLSLSWWLDRGRELKAEDVFRAGSGWEEFLGRRSYELLTTGEHAKDLYKSSEVRKAASLGVKQVNSWNLSARGLEVRFGEYSVAARAAGDVAVALSWEELKPYLAEGFDPAMLPRPVDVAAR